MPAGVLLVLLRLVLEYSPEIIAEVAKLLSPATPDLTDENQAKIDLLIAQGAEAALARAKTSS